MPKYFFDIHDGEEFQQDLYGMELSDVGEVAAHGACLVREILCESTASEGVHGVSLTVRSSAGAQVYVAHCDFQAAHLRAEPS